MTPIAILYMIAAFTSIVASAPQVLKLYRVKASDEFQLSTWVVWLFTQCVSLAYMVSIGNVLLMATNILWVSFYLLMVILIIKYNPKVLFRIRTRRITATLAIDNKS